MEDHRLRHSLIVSLVALCGALLSGCYTQLAIDTSRREPAGDSCPGPADVLHLSLRTERPWYERPLEGEGLTVWAKLENRGDETVLLTGCPNPPTVVVEKWDGSSWQDKIIKVCLGIFIPRTVEFEPGESLEVKVHVREPGWYRIRLLVGPDTYFPDAVVRSNQFLIR